MHNFISINGQIQERTDEHISGLSSAALFSKGIFTTIAVYESRPFLWEKHWRRLTDNAAAIGIDLSEYKETSGATILAEVIKSDGLVNGRARVTFLDESPSAIWSDSVRRKTSLSIITGEPRRMPDEFKLTVSPYLVNSTSPLAGVKSCNYLENVLAMDEAKARGFHEAVRLNEHGKIASGCMANLFWLKGETLYTPSLAIGGLAGTTREFVLQTLECREVTANFEQLREAEQIFLTSAGIGVVCAAEFEGKRLSGQGHPILDLLPTIV